MNQATRTLAAIAGCAAAVVGAPAAVAASDGSTTAVPACTAAATQVWLGDGEGGGTAGTTFYPLEFSNVGHRTCSLFGYPGVSAFGSHGQIGPAADRNRSSHTTVTLAPGATAHAILGIHDWGALCSRRVGAEGLKVFAPGQRQAKAIEFGFGACAHRSVLTVGPVRRGVGIPGFTTS